jgi:ABC-type branched-subunit amino acid transport system ATPase component
MTALLEIRDLTVRFGGTTALDHVSVDVPPGSLFGLIGPNGAGKSTLIDAVTGYLPQARGQVRFAGEPLMGLRADRRA